jgi:quinoprotein glucose dehydrogenase
MLPGNAGGTNWGGVAVAPERNLMVLNVLNLAFAVTLLPSEQYEQARRDNPGVEISPQRGTPYAMRREMLNSPWDVPCVPPPWGTLAALELTTGEVKWETEFGSLRDFTPVPFPIELGTGNVAGPLVTGGGLIFIGALDNYLRAYGVESGELLWKGRLPASAQANPMTYRLRQGSKQYVVVAAGGHGKAHTVLGDSLVAFALE